MEIIKHGSWYKKEHSDIKYTTICQDCGCQFVATIPDLYTHLNYRNKLTITVRCPECYSEVFTDIKDRATEEEVSLILKVNGDD